MPFRVDTKTIYSILKLRNLYSLKSYPVGPNNWGIFLILPVTTGEGVGPAGEISPVVCMLKNGLSQLDTKVQLVYVLHLFRPLTLNTSLDN